jgi:hypothetical protein
MNGDNIQEHLRSKNLHIYQRFFFFNVRIITKLFKWNIEFTVG